MIHPVNNSQIKSHQKKVFNSKKQSLILNYNRFSIKNRNSLKFLNNNFVSKNAKTIL